MLPILEYDLYKYLALAVMLLAILFAYRKGREVPSARRNCRISVRYGHATTKFLQAVGRLLGLTFLSLRLR